jgi:ribose transport system permease protein
MDSFVVLATPLAIAAAGTTVVLITGGFDLSVAGVISLANVLAATQMVKHPGNVWLIAALIVIAGIGIGVINGVLVAFVKLQSLGVTLASYIILTGAALVILPAPGALVPKNFVHSLTTNVGPFPVAILVLAGLVLLWLIFTHTRTGIAAFALGADPLATRMSGVRVRAVEVTCYAVGGGLYAIAGLYLSAVTASGDPNAGQPFLLTTFTAMALGLVSFRGGSGSVIAVIFGAGCLIVISKVLFALGVAGSWTGTFTGTVVLVALALPLTVLAIRRCAELWRRLASRFTPSAHTEVKAGESSAPPRAAH